MSGLIIYLNFFFIISITHTHPHTNTPTRTQPNTHSLSHFTSLLFHSLPLTNIQTPTQSDIFQPTLTLTLSLSLVYLSLQVQGPQNLARAKSSKSFQRHRSHLAFQDTFKNVNKRGEGDAAPRGVAGVYLPLARKYLFNLNLQTCSNHQTV